MTSGRDTGRPDVAGGLARHIPVLVRDVVSYLNLHDGGTYIDGTFGGGGYSRALLAAADCKVIAIDRDASAIAAGARLVAEFGGRLALVEGRFSNLDDAAEGTGSIDGVVSDLGVSSQQLDTAERGFSFRLDGPLDMRMGRGGPSAADVVAKASERDLATIIAVLGEERHARGVARAVVHARADSPVFTTRALAEIVARVVRHHPGDIHPATRTFQGLRMFVNDELGEHAMSVLKLHASHHGWQPPERTERCWPVGNRQAGIVAGDQRTGNDQQKRRSGERQGEAMVGLVIGNSS